MASRSRAAAAAEPESDEDDYVFYGTKLFDEEGLATGVTTGSKPDPATTRSLPVHQQVATDEQGRKRFHGAFTGGFSAGYYNTVGSKEGWAPSSFMSSRNAPAQRKQQSVEDFLDEDELEEKRKRGMTLTATYDTFRSSAAAAAASEAAAAAAERPSAIPGAVPLEFFTPVSSSIGVQLLQKMGWRQGKGIGSKGASTATASKPRQTVSHPGLDGALFSGLAELAGFRGPSAAAGTGSESDGDNQHQHAGSSKWGTVAGVSIENTPLYVLDPKQDLHGLGFDPFEGAEEFRSRKRRKLDAARAATGGMSQQGESGFSGRGRGAGTGKARGIAFGTGALEESDTLGYMEDYIDTDADVIAKKSKRNEVFAFEEASDSDDDDRFAPARKTPAAARIAAAKHDPTLYLQGMEQYTQHGSFIPGFKAASNLMHFPEYPPPKVPPGFVAFHTFRTEGEAAAAAAAGAGGGGGGALACADHVHMQRSELALAKAAAASAAAAAAAAQGGSEAAVNAAAAAAAAAAAVAAAAAAGVGTAAGGAVGTMGAYPPPPPDASVAAAAVAPAEVPPPADGALVRQIDSLAAQVVRSGQLVEDLAKKQAASNSSRYQFLVGGPGADFYRWKLHCLRTAADAGRAKAAAQQQQQQQVAAKQQGRQGAAAAGPQGPRRPLTVEQRMAMLGETPLPASAAAAAAAGGQPLAACGSAAGSNEQQRKMLGAVAATDQFKLATALNSAFVKGSLQDMGEAYQQQQQALAGLRHPTKQQAQQPWQQQQPGVTIMDESSDAATAGAGALSVARVGMSSDAAAAEAAAAAAAAAARAADLPVRTFEDWRPIPLLCKRFNVPDPYKGKAAPVEMPKFRTEFLALPDTAAAHAAVAAAEEEQRMLEWQQHQQQQGVQASAAAAGPGGKGGPVDAALFLDDLMQEVQQEEALDEATQAARAAAAKAAAITAAAGVGGLGDGAGARTASAATVAAAGHEEAGGPAEGAAEGVDPAAAAAAAAAVPGDDFDDVDDVLPVIDKPMDLFKAIFEDDATESEEDEEQPQEQQQQQQGVEREAEAAAALGQQVALFNAGAAGRDGEEEQQQERDARRGRKLEASDAPGAKGLAEAFMRRTVRQPTAPGSDDEWQRQRQQQQQQPLSSQKQEILQALAALRSNPGRSSKQEKEKKHKKKHKKEKKSSKGSQKASKSSKHKRSSSKQHKKRRRHGSYSSSGSDSSSESGRGSDPG